MVRTRSFHLASCYVAAGIWLLPVESAFSEPVPALITQLASSDRNVRREAALQLGKAGPEAKQAVDALVKALRDEDKQVWSNAVSALAVIGPDAGAAVPALIQALDSRTGRGRDRRQMILRASYALTRIGPAAIPALIQALASDDISQRIGASKALAGMGSAAREAIPALVLNLGYDDLMLRRETVETLGEIGAEALKPLVDALASDQTRIRENAVLALGRLGGAGITPPLLAMFKSERESVVRAALFTILPSLQVEPAVSTPLLAEGIRDQNESIRRAAINALLLMRPVQGALLPALVAMLKEADPAVNERAADILGRMGAAAKEAVPELIETVVRRHPASLLYIDALAQIGPGAVPLIFQNLGAEDPDAIPRERWNGIAQSFRIMGGMVAPALTAALADSKPSVRLISAQALGDIGLLAAAAAPALLRVCGDSDPRVRSAALGSLVAIRTDQKTVLARVETALHDPVPSVRLAALKLVPAFGDNARPLGASVLAALKEEDATLRRAAIQAVGPSMPQAVPPLVQALQETSMQPDVFDALARIGPAAAPAAPPLFALLANAPKPLRLHILASVAKTGAEGAAAPAFLAALKESDPEIRAAALAAYPRIEQDGATCRATLIEALKDPELKPRLAAAEALGALGGREPDTLESIAALAVLLQKNEERPVALAALKRLDVRTVSFLMETLAMPDAEVRVFACERLAAVGPKAHDALPPLRAILQGQPSEEVRRAARRAVQQIEAR